MRSDHNNNPKPTVSQQLIGVQIRHHHINAAAIKPTRTAVKNIPFRNSPIGNQANIVAGVSLRGPTENSIGNRATKTTTTNRIRTEITPYRKSATLINHACQLCRPVVNGSSLTTEDEFDCVFEAVTQNLFALFSFLRLSCVCRSFDLQFDDRFSRTMVNASYQ